MHSTPPGPEAQFGTGPGSQPLDARRTQVAAFKLYSGLVAGWSDRLTAARANLVRILDRLGRHARLAASRLPSALPSAPLWKIYHQMNVFELGQLSLDLFAQNAAQLQSQPSGQLRAELTSGLLAFERDLYGLYLANNASGRARTRKLDTAAKTFKHDASKFASIPGLASAAPNVPLSARLFGFAVEGLTNTKPAPVAAP